MGTKNNPGEFDCYLAADPDEPMFVLLARDVLASDLVYEWARRYEVVASIGDGPTEREVKKIAEARACADAMRDWHSLKRQAPVIGIDKKHPFTYAEAVAAKNVRCDYDHRHDQHFWRDDEGQGYFCFGT